MIDAKELEKRPMSSWTQKEMDDYNRATGQDRETKIRESLGKLLKLVEDGVLVRNAEGDEDFAQYVRRCKELVTVLQDAKAALML